MSNKRLAFRSVRLLLLLVLTQLSWLTTAAGGEPVRLGDVNGDGAVSPTDALLVQKHVLQAEYDLDAGQLPLADVNGDASVDAADAALMKQYYLKKTESLSFTFLSAYPANEASGVDAEGPFELIFHSDVSGVQGKSIRFRRADDDMVAATLDAGDTAIDGNRATLTPHGLQSGTAYYVEIDPDAFTDSDGNRFAGIADKQTWRFTTLDVFDPMNVYVQAGAPAGGIGTKLRPFPTVGEGIAEASVTGTVYLMEGTYPIADQLVIDKPLTLKGEPGEDGLPTIVFDPATNVDGLVVRADNVTIDSVHLIANRAKTGDNAVFEVPLKTASPISLYENFTLRSSIVEGTTRSGYIWVRNLTVEDSMFIHNADETQALRLQLVQGTTQIRNNVFRGGDSSLGAIVFEPNVAYWKSSGTIRITGNTATSFTQFVNFFPHLDGPTNLIVENNIVDHQTASGSAVILFSRPDYNLIGEIMIRGNTFINSHADRLAVYYTGAGTFLPGTGQIKVYDNKFDFGNTWGKATDTVHSEYPVGYSTGTPAGTSLGIFDLNGNETV